MAIVGRLYYNEKKREWSLCTTQGPILFVVLEKPSTWLLKVELNDGCGPRKLDTFQTEKDAIGAMLETTQNDGWLELMAEANTVTTKD